MSEHTFTPGPLVAVNGQGAHYRDWYVRIDAKESGDKGVATARCCSSRVGSMATVEANARLYASAPDLFSACKMIRDDITNRPYEIDMHDLVRWADVIDAALAKARGKIGGGL